MRQVSLTCRSLSMSRLACGVLFSTAMILGCSRTDQLPAPSASHANQTDSEGVISQIEKESNITLFKKDITFRDVSGKNVVVIRFASDEKQELDNYLNNLDIKVTPVYSKATSPKIEVSKVLEGSGRKVEMKSQDKLGVISETMSVSLEKNAKGFRMDVLSKEINESTSKNARKADFIPNYNYYYSATHVTPSTWPEILRMYVHYYPNPWPSGTTESGNGCARINYTIDYKWRWYSSWERQIFGGFPEDIYQQSCDANILAPAPSTSVRDFNIDGPRQVGVNVRFYYGGSYSVEYINN